MKKSFTRFFSTLAMAAAALSLTAAPQVAQKAGAHPQLRTNELCKTVGQSEAPSKTLALPVKNAQSKSLIRSNDQAASSLSTTKLKFREGATLPAMYGSVIYSDTWSEDNVPKGIYTLPTTATGQFQLLGLSQGNTAFQLEEYVYTCIDLSIFGMFLGVTIDIFDPATWELVGNKTVNDWQYRVIDTAPDPATGILYAITYNTAASALQLATLAPSETNGYSVTAITDMAGMWNSIAFAPDGQLYGILAPSDAEATLHKIDKATGEATLVGPTGHMARYLSSSEIDPKTGKMYWTVCTDDAGYITEVNLATGAATGLFQFPGGEEVTGLFFPTPAAEDTAPAAVTDLVASFPEGSLTGTIEFVAPSTLFNGTEASGNLNYTIIANDQEFTGTTTYGAEVARSFTAPSSGMYTFTVYVSNEVGNGPKTRTKCFIGTGIPKATTVTATYADGTMTVNWTAVTESVDGGYIDPAGVTYTVARIVNNGEPTTVATSISATTYTESFEAPADLTNYAYTVVAEYAGATSDIATSNTVMLGEATLPFMQDFTAETAMQTMVVVDANEDGRTWTRQNGGTSSAPDFAARYQYHGKNVGDDWLFTPLFNMEAGKAYPVTFLAWTNSNSYQETFEVKYGTATTPDAMTVTILEPTTIQLNGKAKAQLFTAYVTPPTSGKYCVGFHAISQPDQFYLYIDDINIGEGLAATAPDAPTLTLVPDPSGDYKMTVNATAPTLDFAGNPVQGLTKMEIMREGTIIKTFDNPTAGQLYTYVDELEQGGTISYSAVAYNADGKGKSVSASQFVGTDKPAAPENITIVETSTLGEVTLSWDPVTKDHNGNTINPARVNYIIAEQQSSGWVPKFEGLTETSKTFMALEDPTVQDFAVYAVFAKTEGGENGAVSDMIPVGPPYMGMIESFPDKSLSYILGMRRLNGTDATWELQGDDFCPSVDNDNGTIAHKSNQQDGSSALFTGKIDLTGMTNPGVSVFTYNLIGDDPTKFDTNEYRIEAKELAATEWTVLTQGVVNDLGAVNEWHKISCSLEAFANKIIQVRIVGVTKMYVYTIFDDIRITSQVDYDLAMGRITAPEKVKTGTSYNVQVEVKNDGQQPSAAATVDFFTNGQKVATKSIDVLESGKKATVEFTAEMSALATEPVQHYAVVNYPGDLAPDNNTSATVTVNPIISTLPVPTELVATFENSAVTLAWNEPNLEGGVAETVTETFEEAESWAHELEGWTFIDVDQSPVGGVQNRTMPGIEPGTTLASFFVFDNSDETQWNQTFAAQSGHKYLAALFRYDDGTTDDWAVLPELDGSAQTITFYAKSYSTQYPEKMALYYSTTGTEISDFTELAAPATVPGDWTLFTANVPEGALYFAIRSCGTGSFIMMVDDVTFTKGSASANLALMGYNVYRNGNKINEEIVEEIEYTDASGTVNDTYQVTAIYQNKGESAGSNAATPTPSGLDDAAKTIKVSSAKGMIIVSGANAHNVSIANIEGKTIYSATGNAQVAVAPGVYIVKVDNRIFKIFVK